MNWLNICFPHLAVKSVRKLNLELSCFSFLAGRQDVGTRKLAKGFSGQLLYLKPAAQSEEPSNVNNNDNKNKLFNNFLLSSSSLSPTFWISNLTVSSKKRGPLKRRGLCIFARGLSSADYRKPNTSALLCCFGRSRKVLIVARR